MSFRIQLSCLMAVAGILLLGERAKAQQPVGAQIYSTDAHLYGRFEVSMRSAGYDGVISSFFLYNLDVGCNWPEENNEIDIEMTGNSTDLLFTTHYPGAWYITDTYDPPFNPHTSIQDYAIEWEPGIVRWFVNDSLVLTQDHDAIDELIYPLRIVMNLYAADNVPWLGEWDPASMPLTSQYDYVRSYSYTPGEGTHGTNNAFSLKWEDNFETLDTARWEIEHFTSGSDHYTYYGPSSVRVDSGYLYLAIEEEEQYPAVPVTFSVDMSQESLDANDRVYLNGTFNDWCGTCTPMQEGNDGIWTKTLDLEPDRYEYLFTKNNWEENGGAPQGSECDFQPCDEWLNYGFVVPLDSDPIQLETVCWNTCYACAPLSVNSPAAQDDRTIIGIHDLLGRPVDEDFRGVQIRRYDDGSYEKVVLMR